MKQLNMAVPGTKEEGSSQSQGENVSFEKQENLSYSRAENMNTAGSALMRKPESVLLRQVRQNFGFYGGISLTFGISLALFFYKSLIGLNVFLFSALIITLLYLIMKKLSVPIKTGTKLYYTGVLLLGLSTCLTSSGILQFLNVIGILFLLDLSLLHQFYDVRHWDFVKHTGRMFGMIFYSIASFGMPFVDGTVFLRRIRIFKNDRLRNILLGLLLSIPALFITAKLLSDADMVFGKITRELFRFIFSADIICIINIVLFGFFACYCILCGALYKEGQTERNVVAKADATIAVTFMTVMCVMYAIFCSIQLVYLFANGVFTLPDGITFAEYARKGFFELLGVTFINIIIMLVCNTFFKESKPLRLLVTIMTACTYIMIISAAYRMFLYIEAYNLTFLRLFVLLTLLIDAFILAGIILAQYKREFPLFQYCVIVVSICYLTFSFSKPDTFIASYLADHKDRLDLIDMQYMTQQLSLDAAPEVLSLLNEKDKWDLETKSDSSDYYQKTSKDYVNQYYNKISNSDKNNDIRDFNFSNYHAVKSMKNHKSNRKFSE